MAMGELTQHSYIHSPLSSSTSRQSKMNVQQRSTPKVKLLFARCHVDIKSMSWTHGRCNGWHSVTPSLQRVSECLYGRDECSRVEPRVLPRHEGGGWGFEEYGVSPGNPCCKCVASIHAYSTLIDHIETPNFLEHPLNALLQSRPAFSSTSRFLITIYKSTAPFPFTHDVSW